MANIDEQYKCQKCGSTLLKSNKLLHDLKCNPSINVISNNSINSPENKNNNLNNNINNNNLNNDINNFDIFDDNDFNKSLNNNFNNNNNNINPFLIYNHFISDKDNNNDFLCDICGLKMKLKDKADHLLCHQMNLNENENNIEDRELNGNDIDPIGYHFDNNYLFDSFRRNRDRLRDRNLINNNRREIINNSLDDDEDEEEGDNVVGNSYNSLDDEFLDDYNDGL